MKKGTLLIIILITAALASSGQESSDTNRTDAKGNKQGLWVKKYPNGNLQYKGVFKDNKPVGEFIRYDSDNKIKSVLIYRPDGKTADATFYHKNGFISLTGRFVNQLKEGTWKYFSEHSNGWRISEEEYSGNLLNGLSVKYYPDSSVMEKIRYSRGKKEGEWIRYHPNGKIHMKTSCRNNKFDGLFEAWYEDGKPQISGSYVNDMRDGIWKFFLKDGKVKYVINYKMGIAEESQMDKDAENFFNRIEVNKGAIPDPEKTGTIR